jgi:hypothetical protein
LLNIKGRFIVKDDTMREVQCFWFGNSLNDNPIAEKKIEFVEDRPIMREEAKRDIISKEEVPKKITKRTETTFEFDFSDYRKGS